MEFIKKHWKWIVNHKYQIILLTIFFCAIFLRFYQMDTRNPFGYDQVDNAWAAKNIVVDHQLTFIGMPAKANSGIYIGPAYYYFIAFFYWLTNLNPIASGIAAGVTSIFTFWVIFFVSRKMFSKEVALIAVIINTFTMQSIAFDRVQVPINFIPAISLLIFYFLYKIIQGNAKYIPILALLVGFFFNIHFTAIFFPIIIALSLPFFPKKKETIKYFLIAIPAFLIWVLPSTISEFQKKTDYSSFGSYLELNYHGFHLRRVFQLAEDGLIQFNMYLFNEKLNWLKFVSIPIFFLVYLYKSVSRKKLLFCYLVILWFIVPWFGFATYSGEITDYYFSINRFIALMIISFFLVKIWMIKNIIPKLMVSSLLAYVIITNIIKFIPSKYEGLLRVEREVSERIDRGEIIKYQQGAPESYIYYFLTKEKERDAY